MHVHVPVPVHARVCVCVCVFDTAMPSVLDLDIGYRENVFSLSLRLMLFDKVRIFTLGEHLCYQISALHHYPIIVLSNPDVGTGDNAIM